MSFCLFTVKAPFTHRFQITSKVCDIIKQKWPLNGCTSQCYVFKHGGVYTVSVFDDVFIFVSNVHVCAAAFGPETLNSTTSNWTTAWSKCIICIRMFWISTALDWPKVDVLCLRVLNLYMLIPVISFCVHTEEITSNLLVMLKLLILVNCRNEFTVYFFKGPVHTWSLNGNLPVKSVGVKGAIDHSKMADVSTCLEQSNVTSIFTYLWF